MVEPHLRESIEATRSQLKAAQRVIRTSLRFLADLEEQLDAFNDAQPEEAQRNGNGHATAPGRIVIGR